MPPTALNKPAEPTAGLDRPPSRAPLPPEICGYPIDTALDSTQAGEADFMGPSYLAIGPGGRGITLKPLDQDCLHKNGLHPSIKDRLGRVRELALASVANLYGVERDPQSKTEPNSKQPPLTAWLIWEYVTGRPLHEYAADAGCSQRKLALAARELVLAVEALHRQGIIHGAIRPSNIIVDAHGNLRLTHVSPLLYTDPADDVWGVVNSLNEVLLARQEDKTPLGRIVAKTEEMISPDAGGPAPGGDAVLRILATRLSAVIEARDRAELSPLRDAEPESAPRRRSIFGALSMLVLGAGIVAGIWYVLQRPDIPWGQWLQSIRERLQP